MKRRPGTRGAWALILCATFAIATAARAEVVEEIVAKVNDDIITKSELDQAEQGVIADIYRRYAGKDLDEQVKNAKSMLLRRMIDEKILFHRAQRMYDMDKMGDVILRSFKEQQQIKSDQDLEKMLTQEGMTIADLKRRLIETYAPEEVLRFEVGDRVAVGDKEVDAYYAEHPDEFRVPAQATVREIVILADDASREERRAAAERIRERVAAPDADFGAVAREVSEAGTRESGGLLGELKKGDLAAPLDEQAFGLPVGQVGPIIETPYGFHILKIESRSEERLRTLDETREAVRSQLVERRYAKERKAFLDKCWEEATVVVMPAYRDRLAPGGP